MSKRIVILVLACGLALSSCSERGSAPPASAETRATTPGATADTATGIASAPDTATAGDTATTMVRVFFTRDERAEPLVRRVPRTRGVLRAALLELLEGPTTAEQEAGYRSFFSPATAGMLANVTVDENGRAVVDFVDFSRVIPNASSSTGSTLLLAELDSTVFQFPTVRSVVYRFEGDCDAFWNWLQRDCQVVPRPSR